MSSRREGGPELFCSARGLGFPSRLWDLEEEAACQQGPARAFRTPATPLCDSQAVPLCFFLPCCSGPQVLRPSVPSDPSVQGATRALRVLTAVRQGHGWGLGPPGRHQEGWGEGVGRVPAFSAPGSETPLVPLPSIRTGAHPQIPPHSGAQPPASPRAPAHLERPPYLPLSPGPQPFTSPSPSSSCHLPTSPGRGAVPSTPGPAQLALSCPCRRRLGGGRGDPPRVTATHQACGFLFTSPRWRLHWEWGLRW